MDEFDNVYVSTDSDIIPDKILLNFYNAYPNGKIIDYVDIVISKETAKRLKRILNDCIE